MKTSIGKQIDQLLYTYKGSSKQKDIILLLFKEEMSKLQEALQEQRFVQGSYTEEMDEFITKHIENLI